MDTSGNPWMVRKGAHRNGMTSAGAGSTVVARATLKTSSSRSVSAYGRLLGGYWTVVPAPLGAAAGFSIPLPSDLAEATSSVVGYAGIF